ncbi:putative interleukin-17 receptor E-like [Seriola aureovittata]|uniref:putative interleukin-17 receptor E-like n=1 Tax=Seriola aureovittata TaxID=2871759 RepID=UPI0024BEE93E|nr:putative interleukin-17 receptor E-like [Seriola aureovittata]XP_056224127.1 putative interleukin-17 receptor E-like [Seriola aureovittata]
MILWVALLSHFCLGPNGAVAESTGLERIDTCGTSCSQGLHCKTKPDYVFRPPCQNITEGLNMSSVFHDISLSTVMRCEGRQKCSLRLRIKTLLQLTESIHGLSVCTVTAGMIVNCQIFSFTRSSRGRMSGLQVEVENDCTEVSPSQQVQVIVKTVPSYCGISWFGTYETPECMMEDLRRHVPDCITGRLSYDVNPERKELSVSVSDMLEDHSYHLRLCYKGFICFGTGASTLIKKEEPVKAATLLYSRPLPCLCIEGWSAVMDAPRVQVCPFKDRLEELWFGVVFDPLEETLSWESLCPVTAVVALCQEREGGVCEDLPHASQNVSRGKITFTEVDPHPQLCMKFTVGSQSWTRCPFAGRRFQAWEVAVTGQQGHKELKITSQMTATFSVGLCVKSPGPGVCQLTKTHPVHVEKKKAVVLNLAEELCNSCVQVKRLGVKYAATVTHCLEQCNQSSPHRHVIGSRTSLDLTWVVVPAGVCLSGIIITALVLHVLLTVHQRNQKRYRNQKQIDHAFDSVATALKTHPHGGILIPDSLQCGNTEKANLISQ